jgi:hypothetical protein
LKKRKEAEKVIAEPIKEQVAVEDYIKPGKASHMGFHAIAQRQATESKVGNLATVKSSRPIYGQLSSQSQSIGGSQSLALLDEMNGAQQSLLQTLKNSITIIVGASSDLEIGIQLPPLGNDAASLVS